ncbi:MAG: LamG-like jellyroll fold domain-containing protein [Kangiellaceae bacterium]|nr:LamG-like jellyroll fold domain-containing protein [Kangiellaceae bacterium]
MTGEGVLCYTWEDKVVAVGPVEGTEVLLPGGSANPAPVYDRGLYFDGDDYLTISNLILSTTYSISTWIRPDSTGGHVFAINGSELTFGLSDSKLTYTYDTVFYQTSTISTKWTQIHIAIELNGAITSYINGSMGFDRATQES